MTHRLRCISQRLNLSILPRETDCEFAVMETQNDKTFPAMIYDATNMMECEQRGQGLLNNTAHRVVRTLFDIRNCKHGNLVLGEVINAPGRWSSYPPHHHMQPELYHYRFTEPQGYGHGECGDHVFKVRQYDTYKIMQGNDHALTHRGPDMACITFG